MLEQSITDLTAAVRELTATLKASGSTTEAPAKTTRGKKTDTATVEADFGPVLAGHTPGTRYFESAAHNSVFFVQPNDPMPSVPDMVQISSAAFTTRQAQLAQQFAHLQSSAPAQAAVGTTPTATVATGAAPTQNAGDPFGGAAAASSRPPAPACTVTRDLLMATLKALRAIPGGPDALNKVLAKYNTQMVSQIPDASLREAFELAYGLFPATTTLDEFQNAVRAQMQPAA